MGFVRGATECGKMRLKLLDPVTDVTHTSNHVESKGKSVYKGLDRALQQGQHYMI